IPDGSAVVDNATKWLAKGAAKIQITAATVARCGRGPQLEQVSAVGRAGARDAAALGPGVLAIPSDAAVPTRDCAVGVDRGHVDRDAIVDRQHVTRIVRVGVGDL